MKKYLIGGTIAVAGILLSIFLWTPLLNIEAEKDLAFDDDEADLPSFLTEAKDRFSKEEFLMMRAEYFGMRRGLSEDEPVDPQLRQNAVLKMDDQEFARTNTSESGLNNSLLASWSAIGPNPIPNGNFPWSGRTISIAVHPTNPDILYVGTAQGGLYRSLNGGISWTPLMDEALSLAIGAIVISPTDPETIYVGTGEHNFSADSFFGVGVYKITNASTTANLSQPLNKDSAGNDIFSGRGISRIIIAPNDPNTIFVATTSGVGGIGGVPNNILPSRGVYRSTNATAANPTFEKLTGLLGNANASVRDIAIDPANANILIANVVAGSPAGGIYRSADALAASPTFSQTQVFDSNSTSELTAEFAAIHPSGDDNATFYAATGNLGGRVLQSTDGGTSWTEKIDNNFCTPQCFYDIAVAVDPTDVNRVYLGGSPALVFASSTDGGTSFTNSSAGLHVDSHVIAVAPSLPTTVYFGSDGGIYRSTNSGQNWSSLNNTQFFATQFMSLALHPTDPNFTIGGTQDNGTNYFSPARTWTRVDGGDGGYTVIDQNATDTVNVRMYHTYFNSVGSVLGYATRANVSSNWSFRGCNGSSANGINCDDTSVLFYAPLERGPGNPNTIYYGTDRLYRSDDEGLNHTVVSQAPITSGVAISAIGISPQNDNVRVIGLRNGGIFGTTSGAATLVDLDPTNVVPNNFVARAIVDPNNQNTAYLTLSAFGVNNIYKTTNLSATPPTWTPAVGAGANAVPQVPVNAFVVDPRNSNTLYAGTDIGVYVSNDGGNSWSPFGTGLPRVAVFGIGIANGSPRKLRVATHGKGMYEIALEARRSTLFDYDNDGKTDLSVFRPSLGQWFIQNSSNGNLSVASFGLSSDTLVPADYTGDGKTDIAVFRPSSGEWFVLRSEDSTFYGVNFGISTDVPAPGDFDGDGAADVAVFREATGTWYILGSTEGFRAEQFGTSGDRPVVGDYDGDGKADVAIFRPLTGQWWVSKSRDGVTVGNFGISSDVTVQADYTGDGKTDLAVFRSSTGTWYILGSENSAFISLKYGLSTDIPVPGDYDDDGITDIAVFRSSDGIWYINGSQSGQTYVNFGTNGDIPTPNSYVR